MMKFVGKNESSLLKSCGMIESGKIDHTEGCCIGGYLQETPAFCGAWSSKCYL